MESTVEKLISLTKKRQILHTIRTVDALIADETDSCQFVGDDRNDPYWQGRFSMLYEVREMLEDWFGEKVIVEPGKPDVELEAIKELLNNASGGADNGAA